MRRRYLVTGGAGFIGSTFIRSLLGDESADVVNLDLLTYAGLETNIADLDRHAGYRFVRGDIGDEELVDSLVRGIDVIVNFAAESHVDRSISSPGAFIRSNTLGTAVLLDAARRHRVPRFIHVSTDEVYGPIESGSADEHAPLNPSSPYAASKAAADLIVSSYRRTYGYGAIVTRCTNNYGPYQHPEKLIPLVITNTLRGEAVPIYGDGEQLRDWLWVDDHVRAIRLVVDLGAPGETYNIGSGQLTSNLEIVSRLLTILGAGTVDHVADRPGHDRRYAVDSSKVRALGWEPTLSIDEGLRNTAAWYRDREDWWRPLVTL